MHSDHLLRVIDNNTITNPYFLLSFDAGFQNNDGYSGFSQVGSAIGYSGFK
jgi:hypothetical protein